MAHCFCRCNAFQNSSQLDVENLGSFSRVGMLYGHAGREAVPYYRSMC
jgi:hypothetical protein